MRSCVICDGPVAGSGVTCGKSCAAKLSYQRGRAVTIAIASETANTEEARAKKSLAVAGDANPMFGRSGSSNPAFRHGKYAGVKRYRRRRKDRCEDCGITEQPNGRNLSVHHEDRDRSNNAEDNLVTLCQACHVRRHWMAGDIR